MAGLVESIKLWVGIGLVLAAQLFLWMQWERGAWSWPATRAGRYAAAAVVFLVTIFAGAAIGL